MADFKMKVEDVGQEAIENPIMGQETEATQGQLAPMEAINDEAKLARKRKMAEKLWNALQIVEKVQADCPRDGRATPQQEFEAIMAALDKAADSPWAIHAHAQKTNEPDQRTTEAISLAAKKSLLRKRTIENLMQLNEDQWYDNHFTPRAAATTQPFNTPPKASAPSSPLANVVNYSNRASREHDPINSNRWSEAAASGRGSQHGSRPDSGEIRRESAPAAPESSSAQLGSSTETRKPSRRRPRGSEAERIRKALHRKVSVYLVSGDDVNIPVEPTLNRPGSGDSTWGQHGSRDGSRRGAHEALNARAKRVQSWEGQREW